MSRRYGRVRCPRCHVWYGLDETHTCLTNAAVMAAAFGGPGKAPEAPPVSCSDPECCCVESREPQAIGVGS